MSRLVRAGMGQGKRMRGHTAMATKKFFKDPSGMIVCYGSGRAQSYAPLLPEGEGPFLAPGPNSNSYDEPLVQLAAQLNEGIKNILASRKDSQSKIGFALTDMGIMVAWEVEPTDAEWEASYEAK